MLLEQDPKALGVAVLADHMTGCVAIAVLCVVICALNQQCLEHLSIATNTGNMEWCTQVLGLAVKASAKPREDVNHVNVAFVTRHVQWSPPVRVTLVQQGLGELGVLLD